MGTGSATRFRSIGAIRGKALESPCKGCEDRTISPNCHTNCIAYAEFRAEKDKERKRRSEFEILFHDFEVGRKTNSRQIKGKA